MPIVMVEIAPPAPPAALADAMLEACSAAIRSGRCALDDGSTSTEPVAVAIVRWDDSEGRHAHVEVGMRSRGEPSWSSRSLDFTDADPVVERWRSVGLTVATLAGEMVAKAERAEPTSPSAGVEPLAQPAAATPTGPLVAESTAGRTEHPAESTPNRPTTLWLGAAATAGQGLSGDDALRFGAALDVGWRPTPLPVFARLGGSFAGRPADARGLSVQWEAVTVGVGAVIGTGPFTLEPRVALGVDAVHASVVEPTTGADDSGTHLSLGVHGGADAVLRTGALGFVASADAWHLGTRADILLENQPTGISAANGWALGLGLRLSVE